MATPDIATGNANGLMAFMDFMISKGYGTSGAISPWKSAAKQVFSTVEGDEFGGADVRTFDIDEYLDRFENRSLGNYSAESLRAYRQRFRKAVESYRSYLADPNWKPKMRAGRTARPSSARKADQEQPSKDRTGSDADSVPSAAASDALITYPFPLRSGLMAQLHLPTQLDRGDAERLTNFIRALVFEQPAQLTAGKVEDHS